MTLETQFYALTMMFGSGFLISIFFDGYRVLKDKLEFPKIIIFFIDVGFGIASALFAFYLLLLINNGQIRIIIVLALITGILIYYLTISKYIIFLWQKIFQFIGSIYRLFRSLINLILIKPIKFIYKIVVLSLSFLVGIFYGLFKFIKRLLLNPKKNGQTNTNGKKAGFLRILKKIFRRN